MSKSKIGIDFGTTYSAISYLDRNQKPIYFEDGKSTFPTEALISADGELLLGKELVGAKSRSRSPFRGFKVLLSESLNEKLTKLGYKQELMPKDVTRAYLAHMLKQYRDKEKIDKLEQIIFVNCNIKSSTF